MSGNNNKQKLHTDQEDNNTDNAPRNYKWSGLRFDKFPIKPTKIWLSCPALKVYSSKINMYTDYKNTNMFFILYWSTPLSMSKLSCNSF